MLAVAVCISRHGLDFKVTVLFFLKTTQQSSLNSVMFSSFGKSCAGGEWTHAL